MPRTAVAPAPMLAAATLAAVSLPTKMRSTGSFSTCAKANIALSLRSQAHCVSPFPPFRVSIQRAAFLSAVRLPFVAAALRQEWRPSCTWRCSCCSSFISTAALDSFSIGMRTPLTSITSLRYAYKRHTRPSPTSTSYPEARFWEGLRPTPVPLVSSLPSLCLSLCPCSLTRRSLPDRLSRPS